MNDLVVHAEERKMLWRSLRERAEQVQSYDRADLPDVDVEPALLAALLGIGEERESGE